MKLNKYIAIGALALSAAGFTSCDSKNDPAYTPAGSVNDSQRVFFTSSKISKIVTAEETSFDIYIYRPDLNILDDEGVTKAEMPAQTVSITATCEEGGVMGDLITVPSDVSFAAGSPNAVIKVTYDPSKMKGNHIYPVVLTVAPEYANEYSIVQTTVNVNKEEYTDWEPFVVGDPTDVRNGEGSYTFGVFYTGTEDPVRVLSRYVPTNTDDIQFQFQWLVDNEDPSKGWQTFLTGYTKDGGKIVHIPEQEFAYSSNYDEIVYAADTYTYTGNDKYKGLSFFDPESGLFTLNMYNYISLGGWGPGNEFLQLRGYKDTNVYELTVNTLGQTKVNDGDYEIVSFDFTPAVTYVDYTVVDGELEEEELAAVVEKMTDPEQTEYSISTIDKPQNVALTFPSSGMYTIVAVGYNEAIDGTIEAKCSASASFEFETFNPYLGWSAITENAYYVDDIVGQLFGLDPEAMTVRVDKSDDYAGLYRITNPYETYPYIGYGLDLAPFGSIEFGILSDGRVYFPESSTGVIFSGDEISICSYAYYQMAKGKNPDDIAADLFGVLTDGSNITLSALGGEQTFNFLVWLGEDGPYTVDSNFYLDLNGNAPAGAPKKISRGFGHDVKGLVKTSEQMSRPAFPAFYKAVSMGAASRKLDRNASNKMIRRR